MLHLPLRLTIEIYQQHICLTTSHTPSERRLHQWEETIGALWTLLSIGRASSNFTTMVRESGHPLTQVCTQRLSGKGLSEKTSLG